MQAVGRDAHRLHKAVAGVVAARAHQRAVGQQPDAHRLVVRPRHHMQAVGRDAHRVHLLRVALQRAHERAVGQQPDAHR
eukprot:scaffold142539_cov127-Phaeocystis_antarctica.AAC.1